MKKIISICLILCTILSGCGQSTTENAMVKVTATMKDSSLDDRKEAEIEEVEEAESSEEENSEVVEETSVQIPKTIHNTDIEEFKILESALYEYNGSNSTVIIPDTVTTIGYEAFAYNKNIENIIIPSSVTEINSRAFYKCSNLQEITIPKSVATIEQDAFEGTKWLANNKSEMIIVGDGILYKYQGDKNEVTIPSYVKSISDAAFYDNVFLKVVTGGENVTDIGEEAFHGCNNLESFPFSNKLEYIEGGAFEYCYNLKTVTVSGNVEVIGFSAFSECKNLECVILEEGIKDIKGYCFQNCVNLKTISFPNSLISIGDLAFYGCKELGSVEFSKNKVNYGDYVFEDTKMYNEYKEDFFIAGDGTLLKYFGNSVVITIPDSVTVINQFAFRNDSYDDTDVNAVSTLVIVPGNVKEISNYAFAFAPIETIILEEGVTTIGELAFYNGIDYKFIRNIAIPSSVKIIDNNAFGEREKPTPPLDYVITCKMDSIAYKKAKELGLDIILMDDKDLVYNESLLKAMGIKEFTIVNGVLEGYNGTGSTVTIPDTVTAIGYKAFLNRTDIEKVMIPSSVTTIYSHAFDNCSNLHEITIPKSVTTIEKSAFSGTAWFSDQMKKNDFIMAGDGILICYAGDKTEITIPKGVKRISSYLFGPDNYEEAVNGFGLKIKKVIIPNGVIDIGDGAFVSCENLVDITIPKTVKCIGKETFFGTKWLKNNTSEMIIVGDGVLYRYQGNEKKVTIPSSVKSISYAFANNETITAITGGENVTDIGAYAFWGCTSLEGISFSDKLEYIGESAFSYCENLKTVNLPKTIKYIGDYAFCNNYRLQNVTIDKDAKIDTLGNSVFSDCNNLKSINLPAGW